MKNPENNNELKVLTTEELRSYDGLNHLTDKEAITIIETLKELSLLVHKLL